MSELHEIMERCRELHAPWLAERGEDVQISLLTEEEISATVCESSESVKDSRGLRKSNNPQSDLTKTEGNSTERISMFPPITDRDPGDETDNPGVSWDYDGKNNT